MAKREKVIKIQGLALGVEGAGGFHLWAYPEGGESHSPAHFGTVKKVGENVYGRRG